MKPLEGVKVLDLTRVLAGPFCTMIMSDLGAEIIKIEMPGTGDDSRQFGPFKNGQSLYFLSINRGKKSLSLNLKTEKGKDILKSLVAKADVIIENYRPGTMEKLGLGYDVLKQINPGIIYAASSGFGHTGPDSPKASYDILAQAAGGIMSITGWPGADPTRVGMSLGDITASLYTAIGIMAALYQRKTTGFGQKIDVAMLDCQVAILENALVRYQVEGKSPEPLGNRHPTITTFQAFRASDGHFVVAVGNNELWKKFCAAIGRPELECDPLFSNNGKRTENISRLAAILSEVFSGKTVDEWIGILEKAGIPSSPINTVDRVMNNPQIQARNMIVEVDDPLAGKISIAGNPVKMTTVPEENSREPAPAIGQDNAQVLSEWLGFTDTEISELIDGNII